MENITVLNDTIIIDNKKQSYFIKDGTGETEVKGQRVIIPHFEKLDLFVAKYGKQWTVYEKRSGLSVCTANTAKLATENLYEVLLYQQSYNVNYQSVYTTVNQHIDKNGGIKGQQPYEDVTTFIPCDADKIKILENRIAELEFEIETKKQNAQIFIPVNTEYQENAILNFKKRIAQIKNN